MRRNSTICPAVARLFCACVALILFTDAAAHGDSVLHDFAPNFATLDTEMWLIYEDTHGSGTTDTSTATGPHVIANSYLSNHYDSVAAPLMLTPGGGSTYAKDYITGATRFNLDFGSPVLGSTLPDDQFTLDISGTMSAMDAHNSAGDPSDAKVEVKALSKFYIDASHGGGTSGARVGYLLFDKLALNSFETKKNVFVTEIHPGSGARVYSDFYGPHPAVSVPLIGDRFYEVSFEYQAIVPYGVDPPYHCPYGYQTSYGNPYGGGGSGVPEPATLALMVIALGGVAAVRRRRSAV